MLGGIVDYPSSDDNDNDTGNDTGHINSNTTAPTTKAATPASVRGEKRPRNESSAIDAPVAKHTKTYHHHHHHRPSSPSPSSSLDHRKKKKKRIKRVRVALNQLSANTTPYSVLFGEDNDNDGIGNGDHRDDPSMEADAGDGVASDAGDDESRINDGDDDEDDIIHDEDEHTDNYHVTGAGRLGLPLPQHTSLYLDPHATQLPMKSSRHHSVTPNPVPDPTPSSSSSSSSSPLPSGSHPSSGTTPSVNDYNTQHVIEDDPYAEYDFEPIPPEYENSNTATSIKNNNNINYGNDSSSSGGSSGGGGDPLIPESVRREMVRTGYNHPQGNLKTAGPAPGTLRTSSTPYGDGSGGGSMVDISQDRMLALNEQERFEKMAQDQPHLEKPTEIDPSLVSRSRVHRMRHQITHIASENLSEESELNAKRAYSRKSRQDTRHKYGW